MSRVFSQATKAVEPDYDGYRDYLRERDPGAASALKKKVLDPLKEDVGEHSFKAFIEDLAVVSYDDGGIVLFHPEASWLNEHYKKRIVEKLGRDVTITRTVPEEFQQVSKTA